ncbi:hypothetical protein [Pelagicoccus sp. SDUM812005]|uniref:hypothetical protein n=1 Tax=Pelagicoccus sp. SDUM812005 TaxID=3041257 RepID=UPI00280F6491|nr:hypothetical protein [Pelagicoccus sp. SDUM812005]MDQ8182127.1 hypothetical protein [Pelagicoccus sp. SDUM812005]
MNEVKCLSRVLLAGNPELIYRLLRGQGWRLWSGLSLIVLLGAGVYGATIGLWRNPLQALFAGAKFPAVVFLTCLGNAALNGILAQLYASGLSFRQTTLAILMSFSVASLVLLAMSPLTLFLMWNTPPLDSGGARTGHSVTLLSHVGIIVFAGWCGTWRLYRLLNYVSPSRSNARSTLVAWLAGNLLLGSQVSWILRPFIGNPNLPVEFLRDNPFYGGFYQQVWKSLVQLIF